MQILYGDLPLNCGNKRRFRFLDMARGFIMFSVITEHTEAAFITTYIGPIILAVFWFSSGFTTKSDFPVMKKIRNILIPYFLMQLICVLFSYFYLHQDVTWCDIAGVFYARYRLFRDSFPGYNPILMPLHNSVLWFLPSFLMSLLLFRWIASLKKLSYQVVAFFASLAIGELWTYCPVLMPWSLDTVPVSATILLIGHWSGKYELLRRMKWWMAAMILAVYVILNFYFVPVNFSMGDFGRSVWLWELTALSGLFPFMYLCSLLERTVLCRMLAWFNKGALFVFGLQLVFITRAEHFYAPFWPESWKVRLLIMLIFCFAGGKLVSWLYNYILGRYSRPSPM